MKKNTDTDQSTWSSAADEARTVEKRMDSTAPRGERADVHAAPPADTAADLRTGKTARADAVDEDTPGQEPDAPGREVGTPDAHADTTGESLTKRSRAESQKPIAPKIPNPLQQLQRRLLGLLLLTLLVFLLALFFRARALAAVFTDSVLLGFVRAARSALLCSLLTALLLLIPLLHWLSRQRALAREAGLSLREVDYTDPDWLIIDRKVLIHQSAISRTVPITCRSGVRGEDTPDNRFWTITLYTTGGTTRTFTVPRNHDSTQALKDYARRWGILIAFFDRLGRRIHRR